MDPRSPSWTAMQNENNPCCALTRQHPAGRVARSADSRSSYSVPLEPQSTVHKLFNIPPIYLDWTLSNQPPAKIEPRRHETQPSRRHETQPSRRPSSPTVTKLNPAAGHRAPPWPNSTQRPAIEPRMSCNGNFLYGSILSPLPELASITKRSKYHDRHRQLYCANILCKSPECSICNAEFHQSRGFRAPEIVPIRFLTSDS